MESDWLSSIVAKYETKQINWRKRIDEVYILNWRIYIKEKQDSGLTIAPPIELWWTHFRLRTAELKKISFSRAQVAYSKKFHMKTNKERNKKQPWDLKNLQTIITFSHIISSSCLWKNKKYLKLIKKKLKRFISEQIKLKYVFSFTFPLRSDRYILYSLGETMPVFYRMSRQMASIL